MSKVAIVFWSATGNTETMANCIAEGAGAAAIVPLRRDGRHRKLGEYDVVASVPAMGAAGLEGERVRADVRGPRRLSERQEGGSVRLLRLGRRPVDARLVRARQRGRRTAVQRRGLICNETPDDDAQGRLPQAGRWSANW